MSKVYTIMFWFSIAVVVASAVLLFAYGLNLGIDFKGGSVMELNYNLTAGEERPDLDAVKTALAGVGLTETAINYTGDSGLILRMKSLSEEEHQSVLSVLSRFAFENRGSSTVEQSGRITFPGAEEKRFESIGPVIGNELKTKSITAVVIVLSAVVIYIAAVFRKLSRNLSPWLMGLAAIIALLHDVIIPLGVFAVLGEFYNVEISAVFLAAVLTILGYSVSDTVVVFDRVRENVIRGISSSFPAVVHKSIIQTLTRSLNTTFTTLLSLFVIYFFGGESIRYFSLALIMGIFLGAYSSIFVASPILVWFSRRK